MIILDRKKIFTSDEIALIQNKVLDGILRCRTREAVEATITYARFLNSMGVTNENYPLFIKVLEIGNHWVIDALIGDQEPLLFFSSIQPNIKMVQSCFGLLAERHPGAMYPKTLSVLLGVLQTTYKVPWDGYKNIYSLTISDLNALGKHLDEEKGQEDSLNRFILDILRKISELEGIEEENDDMEEIAIHATKICNFFFDSTKKLVSIIPPVLMVRMEYTKFEVSPRNEKEFKE